METLLYMLRDGMVKIVFRKPCVEHKSNTYSFFIYWSEVLLLPTDALDRWNNYIQMHYKARKPEFNGIFPKVAICSEF